LSRTSTARRPSDRWQLIFYLGERLIGETHKVCASCCRGDAMRQDICPPANGFLPVSPNDVLSDASRFAPIFDSVEFRLMAPRLLFAR